MERVPPQVTNHSKKESIFYVQSFVGLITITEPATSIFVCVFAYTLVNKGGERGRKGKEVSYIGHIR